MQRVRFGTLPSGLPVDAFTMRNADGITVTVLAYGGVIQSLTVPDRFGDPRDVVLGYEAIDDYLADDAYHGALIGRYANRIAGARFTLDGTTHMLAANNGPNALHGGVHGFHRVLWHPQVVNDTTLVLRHTSPEGHEGYPGTLEVTVTYVLSGLTLLVHYAATTDRATPVNITQHSYWNLGGWAPTVPPARVTDHLLTIHADRHTPVMPTLIPTGALEDVDGTPFDFRAPTRIGDRIETAVDQLRFAGGYDHNFVLDGPVDATGLRNAALLVHPESGRMMEVRTTEPGLQFYSGNFLDGSRRGKGGHPLAHRTGCCLETQHFPDSPNQSHFPSTILRPGERFRSTTTFTFRVMS